MRICFALAAMLFVVQVAAAEPEASDTSPASDAPPKASDILKPRIGKQIASPITDRFALRVAYFGPGIDTQFRLDADDGTPGTNLNAERDLGLADRADQARVEMIIRLRERNRLRVDYFKLTRFGDQVLTSPIDFGNQTFDVNDRVQSMIDWRQLGLTYTYSFWHSERFEAGGGIGVTLLEAKARGEVAARNVREERSGVGAFPTIALDGTWRISKRFSFNARGQRLSAHVNDFRGQMAEYHGDVQYRWAGNFAVGLGYTRLQSLLDIANSDFAGRFRQNVSGPEFFIRASF